MLFSARQKRRAGGVWCVFLDVFGTGRVRVDYLRGGRKHVRVESHGLCEQDGRDGRRSRRVHRRHTDQLVEIPEHSHQRGKTAGDGAQAGGAKHARDKHAQVLERPGIGNGENGQRGSLSRNGRQQ